MAPSPTIAAPLSHVHRRSGTTHPWLSELEPPDDTRPFDFFFFFFFEFFSSAAADFLRTAAGFAFLTRCAVLALAGASASGSCAIPCLPKTLDLDPSSSSRSEPLAGGWPRAPRCGDSVGPNQLHKTVYVDTN